jgi:hypothetical protein
MNLTALPARLGPRLGHRLARLFRVEAAHAMFCPCCPEWDPWGEAEAELADALARLHVAPTENFR